jgi:medium-chain acyl-[acyl-carrier-protein] hydrolase
MRDMSAKIHVWSDEYRVRGYECDVGGVASPASICNYLQETAGNHADHLGWALDYLHEHNRAWVLARLHLFLHRRPRWRDRVTVSTWPSGALRAYALREFRIGDADGAELGVATSGWLLIDATSKRPQRPFGGIAEIARTTPPRTVVDGFERLDEAVVASEPALQRASHSDLDVNGHVNNVILIRWALDALPVETLACTELAELEVEFRAEAIAGDVVAAHVTARADDGGAFGHRLVRETDGVVLASLRTRWRPRCSGAQDS